MRRIYVADALSFAPPAFPQRLAKRKTSITKSTAPAPQSAASKRAAPKTDAAQQHFDSAQTYQLAGDPDSAAKEYRRAIAVGLDHLGNLRAARQDYPASKQFLQQAIAANPDDPDPALDLAIAEL